MKTENESYLLVVSFVLILLVIMIFDHIKFTKLLNKDCSDKVKKVLNLRERDIKNLENSFTKLSLELQACEKKKEKK